MGLRRLTADVLWLRSNSAPAPLSDMKVHSWAVYAPLFVHSLCLWMFTLEFLESMHRLLHLLACGFSKGICSCFHVLKFGTQY